MAFRYWYKDPDGDVTEILTPVRIGDAELVSNAEEGSVGTGTVTLNDPTGSFMIRGHRLFIVTETEAAADDFGGVVWVGYVAERDVSRGTNPAVGPGRDISVTVVDINTLLSDRILHGTGNKRPDETEIDRVTWLLGQAEMGAVLDDTTFVADSEGTNLDERDCNGDKPLDVIDDAAQQSGRNYFLLWQDSGGTVPDIYLWYRHGTGSFWPASISISNFPGEFDDPLRAVDPIVFPPSKDASLNRSPSRVFSDIRGDYDGGFVLESKQSTRDAYRIRWTEGQWERVKSETKARHRAQRTLDDIDTELDEITVAIQVPRSKVNAAMAGQLIPVHFQHLPGYGGDDPVAIRIKSRTVREVDIELVELAFTLTGDSPGEGDTGGGTPGEGFAVLDYAHGPYTGGLVRFSGSGDDPPGGWVSQPTVGLITPLSDTNKRPYYGLQIDGTGTIDVSFTASITGVLTKPVVYTVTWSITKNGADVATSSVNYDHSGHDNPTGMTGKNTVSVTGLSVAPGDVIGARLSVAPFVFAFFKTPAGTGTGGEQLKITNGVLS